MMKANKIAWLTALTILAGCADAGTDNEIGDEQSPDFRDGSYHYVFGYDPETGDQIRGFGFLKDGSIDTLFRFVSAGAFVFPSATARRDQEQFMLQFDNDIAPIVGQQVTLTATNGLVAGPRIDLLIARAAAPSA